MEATELLNAGDPRPTEMISADDRPHRLSISGIYEFPFGRGRQFLSNLHPVLDAFIGGWQLNGIYAYQSGPTLGNWGNIIFTGNLKDIPLPQDQQGIGPVSPGSTTLRKYFNVNAGFGGLFPGSKLRTFPFRFGFIRADNIHNFDLSLLKNIRITEGTKLQFRFEALNAFNHPLLFTSQINLNPTAATFGAVTPTGPQENYPRRVQLTLKFIF
jgi:hypothetical protein